MNRLKIKDFRLKIFAVFLLLLINHYSSIINPLFAQTTCTDELGVHEVDTEWSECKGTTGNKSIFSCDHTGTIQSRIEPNHPDCGSTETRDTRGKTTNVRSIFGEIKAPAALQPFIGAGDKGAGGISLFLNNSITLIYIIASVVFVFMILWGAFDLITSGGEKEKVQNARKRLTYAFIGIIFFAIAFALINVVGTFTGFNFTSAKHEASCPTREEYYFDSNENSCMHKYSTGTECFVHFDHVNKSLCGR